MIDLRSLIAVTPITNNTSSIATPLLKYIHYTLTLTSCIYLLKYALRDYVTQLRDYYSESPDIRWGCTRHGHVTKSTVTIAVNFVKLKASAYTEIIDRIYCNISSTHCNPLLNILGLFKFTPKHLSSPQSYVDRRLSELGGVTHCVCKRVIIVTPWFLNYSFGSVVITVYGVQLIWQRGAGGRRLLVFSVAVLVAAGAARTYMRNRDWRTRETLLRWDLAL